MVEIGVRAAKIGLEPWSDGEGLHFSGDVSQKRIFAQFLFQWVMNLDLGGFSVVRRCHGQLYSSLAVQFLVEGEGRESRNLVYY